MLFLQCDKVGLICSVTQKQNAIIQQIKMSSEEIESHVLANYKVLKKIGSGAYGHVYKVVERKTKTIKALKKNFAAFHNSTDAQRTYREIMFLMQLDHPNIIKLHDIIHSQNGKDVYLVFEFMDADLHILIRQNILTERHKKYVIYQTAKAMLYLHSAGLIHRDLKPSNILINQACDAKLCDFGLVRSIDDNQNSQDKLDVLTEYIATRWYRAPEILLGCTEYSKGIDVWGFGCLVAQMMKGKPLFPGSSTINQLQRVLMWTGSPSQSDIDQLHTNFGKQALQIVLKTKKLNAKQFFHEINSQCLDLVSKCLEFNPSKRISIQQIIKHPYLSQFYDQSEIVLSQKKVRIPIDDNRRLSFKDYRALIYLEIQKRNKNFSHIGLSMTSAHNPPSHQTLMHRVLQKFKKVAKTQQSDIVHKTKKHSVDCQKESKTMDLKKNENSKKKTFYKDEVLHPKANKTSQQQERNTNKTTQKERQKQKKLKQQIERCKGFLFKESNGLGNHRWNNRIKRSITEGDGKKDIKLFPTHTDTTNTHKK